MKEALACPKCGTHNQSGSSACVTCATPLPDAYDPDATIVTTTSAEVDLDATILVTQDPEDSDKTVLLDASITEKTTASIATSGTRMATNWASIVGNTHPALPEGGIGPGVVVGERYEILKLLGEGGMGSVFKARDRELDRMVALKVIRPELANNRSVLALFKQEIVLARQVTHRNVIRIFDLGAAGNLKFITMEYVEGTDLKTMLRLKKFYAPEAAADLMLQICAGLEAAHAERVIHRDLKPQNIMMDDNGRALVMDFGLALAGAEGQSGAGGLAGTPDYMSPEQARMGPADERSDLYSLGVIFYELLTGKLPFEAKKASELMKMRLTQLPTPPHEVLPSVPKVLSDMVMRCMAIAPEDRFQKVGDLIYELQVFRGIAPTGVSKRWKALAASLALLVMAVGGFAVYQYKTRPPEKQEPVAILIADFDNSTGEANLNNTLESTFGIAIEEASFITSYNRTQARQLATKIKPGLTKMDSATARLLAVREGLRVVIGGSASKSANRYQFKVNAIDAVSGKEITNASTSADSREQVLPAMRRLAVDVRRALGDSKPSDGKSEDKETFTAASLEAAASYFQGQDLQLQAKYEDAIQAYKKAIELDPTFGRAYSGIGVIYRNLRQRDDAEKYLKLALQHIGQMSPREQYRTRGAYFVTMGSWDKAAQEYDALVKKYPADNAGHANLALCYLYLRNLPQAIEEGRQALAIYPKNTGQRSNLAQYLLYAGKNDDAVKEANEVLKLNPTFERAFLVKALAAAAKGSIPEAAAIYEELGKLSPRGDSYRLMGLADLALLEARYAEAIDLLRQGIAADEKTEWKEGKAAKQVMLAQALLATGKRPAAIAALDEAADVLKENGQLYLAAQTYIQAGALNQALAIAGSLGYHLEANAQAYAKVIGAEIALARKDARGAVRLAEEARKLTDTWAGLLVLGRAYIALDAYTEADSALETAFQRAGESTSLTLDAVPSYSLYPPLLYYLGKARQGMNSPSAAESFKAYVALRGNNASDPLLKDVKAALSR